MKDNLPKCKVPEMMCSSILGYYLDKNTKEEDARPEDVFIAFKIPVNNIGDFEIYCPATQHGSADKEYIKRCKPITVEDYIKYSKGLYTPNEYLYLNPDKAKLTDAIDTVCLSCCGEEEDCNKCPVRKVAEEYLKD